jgi:hypothetical protein
LEAKLFARAMAAPARAASASNALSFASGLNGLSFSTPMACMVKRSSGVKTSAGSSFTSWGEHLEERDVVGVDRVDRLARAVEELHLRRVGRLGSG